MCYMAYVLTLQGLIRLLNEFGVLDPLLELHLWSHLGKVFILLSLRFLKAAYTIVIHFETS